MLLGHVAAQLKTLLQELHFLWIKVKFCHYPCFHLSVSFGNKIVRFDRIILSKDVWILNRVEEPVSFPPNEIDCFILFRCIETKQKHNFTTFREFLACSQMNRKSSLCKSVHFLFILSIFPFAECWKLVLKP